MFVGDRRQDRRRLIEMSFRQIGAIGTWIGDQPVGLVERLTGIERLLGPEAEPLAGVDLKVGKRVRKRRRFRLLLAATARNVSALAGDFLPELDRVRPAHEPTGFVHDASRVRLAVARRW